MTDYEKNNDEIHRKIVSDLSWLSVWVKITWTIAVLWFSLLVTIISQIFSSLHNIELSLNEHKLDTMKRVVMMEVKLATVEKYLNGETKQSKDL